ncbi:MAG: hypothetical protein ACI9W4_002193 [Rhodothermales bacterium]|jgi:hypothetical protein
MESTFSIRSALESAADLFAGKTRFVSFSELAEATGVPEAELCHEFGTVDQLITRYYADLAERCVEMLVELNPQTALDRAGAFTFIMLDLLEERSAYVEMTFRDYAAAWGSDFRSRLADVATTVLDAPDVPGINQVVLASGPLAAPGVEIFVRLVNTWLNDKTEDRQRSTALIDKVVRYYASLATSSTATDGVDVIRYAVEAEYLPRIPFVSDWLFGSETK